MYPVVSLTRSCVSNLSELRGILRQLCSIYTPLSVACLILLTQFTELVVQTWVSKTHSYPIFSFDQYPHVTTFSEISLFSSIHAQLRKELDYFSLMKLRWLFRLKFVYLASLCVTCVPPDKLSRHHIAAPAQHIIKLDLCLEYLV